MKKFEEFKKFTSENPPSVEELVRYTADNLVQAAWCHTFKLFRSRKFRKLLNFGALEQVEQDRIFNELTVTAVLLIMFILEAPDLRVPDDLKAYFHLLKDEIPKAHLNALKELGIEEGYLTTWRRLLDLRYEEYQKDKLGMREAAMELESREGPLTVEGLKNIQILLPVQTLAIGALSHIRRGKLDENDPLFKILLKWVGNLYLHIKITLEGGKITWWRKVIVKLRGYLLP